MEKPGAPINQKLAGLPGGAELWSQYPDDAIITKLGKNLVRVSYLPNPALGRKQTTSQDFRVGFDPSGKAFVEQDTEYLPQLPEM